MEKRPRFPLWIRVATGAESLRRFYLIKILHLGVYHTPY